MSNRTLLFLTGLALLAVVALVAMNLMTIYAPIAKKEYLSRKDVKGISVINNQKAFTLNVDQQTKMIDFLNASAPTNERKGDPAHPLNFEKIVISEFTTPDVDVQPIGYDDDEGLIFTVQQWENYSYLKDPSKGQLKKLIDESYAH